MKSPGAVKLQTSSQRRRERERQALTERILDAAREMFVRDGYEAVTLQRIAEAVEYTPGAIYQYFKDKRALVMAIIRADYLAIRDTLIGCRDIPDPIERLTTMAKLYAAWGVAHPNHYRLMTCPPPAWAERGQELREDENPPIEEDILFLLGGFVADAMETGRVREEYSSPGLVAATLWAAIHGTVHQEITLDDVGRSILGSAGLDFEVRLNAMIQVLMDGFLKPSA